MSTRPRPNSYATRLLTGWLIAVAAALTGPTPAALAVIQQPVDTTVPSTMPPGIPVGNAPGDERTPADPRVPSDADKLPPGENPATGDPVVIPPTATTPLPTVSAPAPTSAAVPVPPAPPEPQVSESTPQQNAQEPAAKSQSPPGTATGTDVQPGTATTAIITAPPDNAPMVAPQVIATTRDPGRRTLLLVLFAIGLASVAVSTAWFIVARRRGRTTPPMDGL